MNNNQLPLNSQLYMMHEAVERAKTINKHETQVVENRPHKANRPRRGWISRLKIHLIAIARNGLKPPTFISGWRFYFYFLRR